MFHREGHKIILITLAGVMAIVLAAQFFLENALIQKLIAAAGLIVFVLILQFFRNPKRNIAKNDDHILSAADGKVVIIEEVFEKEYFKDKRLQISVFMSPLNVHVNRYPASGRIVYSKYHKGKYLVAWHPKSSEKNERTTVVIDTGKFGAVLYRQIAGAVARRIVNYAVAGEEVEQGGESGFIKFGSRLDIFLPLDAKVKVGLNQHVKGGLTVLATS